jgi:hypothetical protein
MIHARIADSNVCLMVSGSKIPRATRKTCAENAGPWRASTLAVCSAFAVESIRRWWDRLGKKRYANFAGIAPAGVPAFIAAQLAGMLAAVAVGRWLWKM